jgi:hypothetical protein
MVERGLLPTLNYIEMGGGGSVLILRIESTQLLCVPRVFDVLPCLGAKYEVARFEGPSAYPSAVVIAEALLVNCRAGESDVSSFIQQVLGICQCLFCVFFDVGHHAGCTVAHICR